MPDLVLVDSFDALRRLRTLLVRFVETVSAALGETDSELQHMREWVRQTQSAHWKREAQVRNEQLVQAKSALTRKKLQKTALGGRPSTVEEEQAYAKAVRRVEEAQQKLVHVKRWARQLDETAFNYQALASTVSQWVTIEIPNALAALDQMLAALEAYAVSAHLKTEVSAAPAPDAAATHVLRAQCAAVATLAGTDAAALCARLRGLTPTVSQRAAAPPPAAPLDCPARRAADANSAPPPAATGLAPAPPLDRDTLVLGAEAGQAPYIYMERRPPADIADSGWFLGAIQAAPASILLKVSVAEACAAWPALENLLAYPSGCVVLASGGQATAVFDDSDRRVWAAPPAETSAP